MARPILAAWIASSSLLGPPVSAMGHLLRNVASCHWQLKVTLSVPVHGEQMNEMPYTSMNSRAISLHFHTVHQTAGGSDQCTNLDPNL